MEAKPAEGLLPPISTTQLVTIFSSTNSLHNTAPKMCFLATRECGDRGRSSLNGGSALRRGDKWRRRVLLKYPRVRALPQSRSARAAIASEPRRAGSYARNCRAAADTRAQESTAPAPLELVNVDATEPPQPSQECRSSGLKMLPVPLLVPRGCGSPFAHHSPFLFHCLSIMV
jgi:hypothetical protein